MTRPILTDQSGTPLIGAGLPPARPRVVIYAAQDWTRHDNGRWFARACLRLALTLAAVCALAVLGLLIYWMLIGVQQ